MYTHLMISLGWFIALMAGAVLMLAAGLWLAGVLMAWWADYRLASWQRRNRVGLHEALRKTRR